MDDLDSLLQDLERATTNLKNNPGNLGAWKLNKPNDPTLTSAYSTAKVAKHYSPQYYVNDEPLYQNETLHRSQSIGSSTTHDYAAINGNGTSSPQPSTPSTMQYQGSRPRNYQPVNSPTGTSAVSDSLSANLSQLDNLLEDLNVARKYFDGMTTSPTSLSVSSSTTMPRQSSPHHVHFQSAPQATTYSSLNRSMRSSPDHHPAAVASNFLDTHSYKPVNGISNGHMANGDLNQQQQRMQPHRSDSFQVNDLIKDLEYNLHSTDSPYAHVNKPVKSVTINANGMQTSSVRPSPPRSAQIQPVSEYNRNLVSIQPQHARMDSNAVVQVPLPHATSNATRELDDLMASLSDFKLNQMKNGQTPSTKNANYVPIGKIKVPSKNPQLEPLRPADKLHLAGDLDSMIGNLESDLNRHGVNTTTKGTCDKCKRAIVGQVVTAMGKTWHPEHFTCLQCGTELGDSTFFERDGLAFCERDYHKLYSPQCAYCNKPILDRCITALEKTWHPEHFSCAHCGKNFGDDGYHEKAGNAYCREDFYNLFAPKCVGCSNPIEDNYVTAMGGQWHSECFVCRDCNTPFNNGSFFDFEGRPYCEPHYHDKRGTLCATCRKPIEGRCITAMSQKYHPEHFTCSFCLKQLNKGTFKKHSEKPYCHSCFDKLFA